MYIYIYIYLSISLSLYIYIYTQCTVTLAQDKGGPSKGGFLNNQFFSYTVLYLFNEINGVYTNHRLFTKEIHHSGNHLY